MTHGMDLMAALAAATRDRLEVLRELGRGGTGIVFLARHLRLDKLVAVKVLMPHLASDPAVQARFLREARAESRLDHRNIVPVFDVSEEGDLSYLVMPYVEGRTLRTRLDEDPRPDIEWVRRVLAETADALAYAHRCGVIHRDVKPENLLIEQETGRVLVLDFGIARVADAGDASLTVTFQHIGTPRYMAPEQVEGGRDLDGRVDQYALGMVGYEMIAGHPAFDAPGPIELLYKQRHEDPPPLERERPDCPRELALAVMRAISRDREGRFGTLDDFRSAIHGEATPHAGESHRAAVRIPKRVWLVVAPLALLALVGAWVFLARREPIGEGARPQGSATREAAVSRPQSLPPAARFTAPDEALVGELVRFDPGATIDPDDPPASLRFSWDLDGDGYPDRSESGPSVVEHRFSVSGEYGVTLVVMDPAGSRDRLTRVVRVSAPPPPSAEAGPAEATGPPQLEWPDAVRDAAPPPPTVGKPASIEDAVGRFTSALGAEDLDAILRLYPGSPPDKDRKLLEETLFPKARKIAARLRGAPKQAEPDRGYSESVLVQFEVAYELERGGDPAEIGLETQWARTGRAEWKLLRIKKR